MPDPKTAIEQMSDIDLVIMRSQVKRGIATGINDIQFLRQIEAELKKRDVKGARDVED